MERWTGTSRPNDRFSAGPPESCDTKASLELEPERVGNVRSEFVPHGRANGELFSEVCVAEDSASPALGDRALDVDEDERVAAGKVEIQQRKTRGLEGLLHR